MAQQTVQSVLEKPAPPSDANRLAALHRYNILDTPPEKDFDDITLLASQICGTPIALISLIDENRQWFKSKIGMQENETPRDVSFCTHGIQQHDVFVVEDALKDERFVNNPMVTGDAKIRFYAGSPLVTHDGQALGMLCVKDRKPRELRPEQKSALEALSRQVVAQFELRRNLKELQENIARREKAEIELKKTHQQLLEASHQAGMAEVATSVLHNVGNVLTSVNVSSSLIAEKISASKVVNVAKVATLLREHEDDLADFFANDSKARRLPDYLENLASYLAEEQDEILHEISSLVSNVVHIREIVAMQQNYAKSSGLLETLEPADLVNDALAMNREAMVRHKIAVRRDFADVPTIVTERHKMLQILVNLIRNAKQACKETGMEDRQIVLGLHHDEQGVKFSVSDNGIGIPEENLKLIFNHGFTTRKEGHGIGLHSGAIAAKELGGSLNVSSKGLGQGATFTLELPKQHQEAAL